jgi:hypothetical protein
LTESIAHDSLLSSMCNWAMHKKGRMLVSIALEGIVEADLGKGAKLEKGRLFH